MENPVKGKTEQNKKIKKSEILALVTFGLPAILAASLWTADLVKKLVKRAK